jgi:hypothetical protein
LPSKVCPDKTPLILVLVQGEGVMNTVNGHALHGRGYAAGANEMRRRDETCSCDDFEGPKDG